MSFWRQFKAPKHPDSADNERYFDRSNFCEAPRDAGPKSKRLFSADNFDKALPEVSEISIQIAGDNFLTVRSNKKIVQSQKIPGETHRNCGRIGDIMSQTVGGKNSSGS
jgi:hypothetical protein